MTKKLEALRAHHRRGPSRSRSSAATTATRSGCCPRTTRCFGALGLSDAQGRIKPSRQAKYRQVEEFLRLLDAAITDALEQGHLRRPTAEDPLRIVDLGCGNAYLTFAAQRYLTAVRGLPVRRHRRRRQGAVPRAQQRGRRRARASTRSSWSAPSPASGSNAPPRWCWRCTPATPPPTRRWPGPWRGRRRLVLAAPCCHHDIAAQLRHGARPRRRTPMLTRHGILRERFADTLTDALRASLMRLAGYRVDVVQFVESQHTPRNTMLRAVRTGAPVHGGGVREEYDDAGRRRGGPAAAARCCSSSGTRSSGEPGRRPALAVAWRCRSCSARRVGRRPTGRCQRAGRSASPTPRSSSPAGWCVAATGSFVDRQRLRRQRPGLRRRPAPPGETVGATRWADEPIDVEALAPGGPTATVWVGDIGDNTARRDVGRRCPGAGRAAATRTVRRRSYPLTYPDGARDAETLLVRPAHRAALRGQQEHLRRHALRRPAPPARGPARTGSSRSARCCGVATDGAFFPDGRHVVLRDYARAVVYSLPGAGAEVGGFALPSQEQGEGIAVDDAGRVLVTSEGVGAAVLAVALPADVRPRWPRRRPRPTPSPAAARDRAAGRPRRRGLPRGPRAARVTRPSGRRGRGASPAWLGGRRSSCCRCWSLLRR